MSDFGTDYAFLMNNEDCSQAHAIVPDAPPGAFAISGINSAAFPTQFAKIAATPQDLRDPLVRNFYYDNFWDNGPAQIASDEVAERVFDAMVNMGSSTACKLLQESVNTLRDQVAAANLIIVDGQWGPKTIAAVNECDPDALKTAFQAARIAHYKAIVAANPADAKYEAAWLARASE